MSNAADYPPHYVIAGACTIEPVSFPSENSREDDYRRAATLGLFPLDGVEACCKKRGTIMKMSPSTLSNSNKCRTDRTISAVDRNGKSYSTPEVKEIFSLLYPKSIKALCLLFPDMTPKKIKARANHYGVKTFIRRSDWSDDEIAILRNLYPDLGAIGAATGRGYGASSAKARSLGLKHHQSRRWTAEEDAALSRGEKPVGRTAEAILARMAMKGIRRRSQIQNAKLSGQDVLKTVAALVPRTYPTQVREEAIQTVVIQCLEGKCSVKPEALRAAIKKAITAVYKLHPERGAPVSMDAKLFDDGSATVGDRISSDTFHF